MVGDDIELDLIEARLRERLRREGKLPPQPESTEDFQRWLATSKDVLIRFTVQGENDHETHRHHRRSGSNAWFGAMPAVTAQEPPNSIDIYPGKGDEWRRGWQVGYSGQVVDNFEGYPWFQQGYESARRQREAEAEKQRLERQKEELRRDEEQRDQLLFNLYGDPGLISEWKRGFGAKFPQPPDKRNPLAFVAYMEGHHAATHGIMVGETARADEAGFLADLFVKQLNAMHFQTEKLYLLLEVTNAEFTLDEDDEVSLPESIARTKLALERTKETLATTVLFERIVGDARRIQPRLVAALEVLQ